MFLDEAYKKCPCGEKLNKRNRFGIKLEAPEHINTHKREKEGKPHRIKTIVVYVCEKCYQEHYDYVRKKYNGTYIYYNFRYPV